MEEPKYGAIGAVIFDSSVKALVPCGQCGCLSGWQHPPVGGQPGNKLTCQGCNKFHGWLSPSNPQFVALQKKETWLPDPDDVIDRGDLFDD